MPGPTYTLISSYTVPSNVSNYTLTSIPSSYRDLVLTVDKPSGDMRTSLRFNSDSGTNYFGVNFFAGASGTINTYRDAQTYVWAPLYNSGGDNRSITTFYLNDYAQTKRKSVLARVSNRNQQIISLDSWIWNNNTAISSIYIEPQLNAGTVINLYGIIG